MKARNVDPHTPVRDDPPAGGDRYARESFTWRRMQPWQIWTAAIGAGVFVIVGLILLY
jgi:hypothetical protein